MDFGYLLELLLAGLTKGSIYGLIALGYTMVYGIIGLINFAHGEIYMVGAFVGLIVASLLTVVGLPMAAVFALTLVAAAAYSGAYGYTLEKVAYRPLRNAPRLSPLISAIGMSIFLQNFVLLAQSEQIQSFPQIVPEFEFLAPVAFHIRGSELAIILANALVLAGLLVLVKRTRIGMAMRAIAQDKKMALLLGINVDRVISVTFVVGSSIAAIGGVLVAANNGQMDYTIGFIAGIKAFTAAVLGGIGSIPGAAVGGLVLGLTESLCAGYFSSEYEDVFAFSLLVLILIFKPAGLLGKEGVDKV